MVPPLEEQQGQDDQQTRTDEPAAEAQDETPPDPAAATTEQPPEIQPKEATETEPVATTGSLRVRSDPSGARILLDNTSRGTTPRTLAEVSAGRHTVVLRLDGYEDYTAPVTVAAQQQRTVNATLVALTGVLQINVNPSGRLSIGGVVRDQVSGTTSIDVPVGSHTVTIENDEYGRWRREVVISTDTPAEVVVDFTRKVSVRVYGLDTETNLPVPLGGQIYVDGEDVGGSPRLILVGVGLRKIEVRMDGYVLDGDAPVINFVNDWEEALPIRLRKIDQ